VNDDLALLHLTVPLPAGMGFPTPGNGAGIGDVITLVGFGRSGYGSYGYTTSASLTDRRFGSNVIDGFQLDDEGSGRAEVFRYDFDAPGTTGLTGGSLGNDIETIIGPGDSGGAALRQTVDGWELVGINTFTEGYGGRFGDTGGCVLVDPYQDWILQTTGISEPGSVGLLMLSIAVLMSRRFWRRNLRAGISRRPVLSPREGVCGHAFDIEAADDEEAAGVFFFGGFVDAGGDEQVCQIGSAEGTGGGFQAGQGDAVEFVAIFRIETRDTTTVTEGDPEVAVGIESHAVRRGVDVAGGNRNAVVAQMARVVIEGEHIFARSIDIIDGFAIGGPDDAIGRGDRAEGYVNREVGIEAIEFGGAGFAGEAHGAGEEAAVGRAFAFVEAVVRFVMFRIGDRREHPACLVEKMKPFITRDDESAALARDDGADVLAHLP
jgi:hypothetical protein